MKYYTTAFGTILYQILCLKVLTFGFPARGIFRPSSIYSSSKTKVLSSFRDGEWVGWECRFTESDGSRLTIPDEYVPSSLKEWDVPVWGFEVFSSEQKRVDKIYRKNAQVFPETGCALDDLSLEKSATLTLEQPFFTYLDQTLGYTISVNDLSTRMIKLEVVLVDPSSEKRVRCRFAVNNKTQDIVGPITISKERRYGDFNDGAFYNQGLDIRTLTELIGSRCFAEYEPPVDIIHTTKGENLKHLRLYGGVSMLIGPWSELAQNMEHFAISTTRTIIWGITLQVLFENSSAQVSLAFDDEDVLHTAAHATV